MREQITEAEISMVLDTYMYLNYESKKSGSYELSELLEEMSGEPEYAEGGDHYNEYRILCQAAENPQIGKLCVKYPSSKMSYDTGTAACTFVDREARKVYVVYRGSGDGEWMDNGLGMTQAVTVQQERAQQYFEQVVEEEALDASWRVVVTGHSKGGNKAQFVTMESKYGELIDRCYSVDGQGFSDAAIDRWESKYTAKDYAERTEKIYGICGENDFVSVLGYSIISEDRMTYLATPVEKTNPAAAHDITYMFAAMEYDEDGTSRTVFHGRKNREVTTSGSLRNYVAELSAAVMALPPKEREGAAMVLMQMIEALHGSPKGLNGEKITRENIKDFLRKGVPLIMESTIESQSGKELWHTVWEQDALTEEVPVHSMLEVDPVLLKVAADPLETIGTMLKEQMEEVAVLITKIPWYLQGKALVYAQAAYVLKELEEAAACTKKLAMLQRNIAQIYVAADQSSVDVIVN